MAKDFRPIDPDSSISASQSFLVKKAMSMNADEVKAATAGQSVQPADPSSQASPNSSAKAKTDPKRVRSLVEKALNAHMQSLGADPKELSTSKTFKAMVNAVTDKINAATDATKGSVKDVMAENASKAISNHQALEMMYQQQFMGIMGNFNQA